MNYKLELDATSISRRITGNPSADTMVTPNFNPYEVLGVKPTAEDKEVNKK